MTPSATDLTDLSLWERLHLRAKVAQKGAEACWWTAVTTENLPQVRALAALGVSAATADPLLLFRAMDQPDPEYLKGVLAAGASPNGQFRNNCWDYALHRAACRGWPEHLAALLAAGAELESRDGNDFTPLAAALHGFGDGARPWGEGRQACARLLLDAGADPAALQNRGRYTPLGLCPMDLDLLSEILTRCPAARLSNPDPRVWPHADGDPAVPPSHPAFRAAACTTPQELQDFVALLQRHGTLASLTPEETAQLPGFFLAEALSPSNATVDRPIPAAQWLAAARAMGARIDGVDSEGATLWHRWVAGAEGRHAADWAETLAAEPSLQPLRTARDGAGRTPMDRARERYEAPARQVPIGPVLRRNLSLFHVAMLEVAFPEAQVSTPSRRPRL